MGAVGKLETLAGQPLAQCATQSFFEPWYRIRVLAEQNASLQCGAADLGSLSPGRPANVT